MWLNCVLLWIESLLKTVGTCIFEDVEVLSSGIITGEVGLWQVGAGKGALRGAGDTPW